VRPGLPVAGREEFTSPGWSRAGRQLIAALSAPLGTRHPVSYQRSFVDHYEPNVSSLLPATLAAQDNLPNRRTELFAVADP
jgi:hypothetical protein